jgi:outer membrane protein OmpA-like peptidoglycan-associated protein
MRIVKLILSALLFSQLLWAGADAELKRKFTDAEIFFADSNYASALPLYLDILNSKTDNANLKYKIGVCYLHSSNEKNKAFEYLDFATKNTSDNCDESSFKEKNAPVICFKYYADALLLNYRPKDALTYYERFKEYIPDNDKVMITEVTQKMEYCYNAIELMKYPKNYIIKNLGQKVNSKFADYSAVISADESVLAFTSRREGTSGGKMDFRDNLFFEDIYISAKNDTTWNDAKNIGAPINTAGHEATVAISVDGQQILIYKDDQGDGNIYTTSLSGDIWSTPQKLNDFIDSKSWEPSACFTADGRTIYFVSNRKGGYGGRDIYRCVLLPNNQWSFPLNMGPDVNTPFDEDAPFMHPDGVTLFFSSKGHKSMGGFDIFYVTKTETGWEKPTNIGYPINTTDDDLFYVLSASGKHAYYSANKPEGFGDKDIYVISYDTIAVDPVVLVKGFVTANGSENVPEDTKITLFDPETGNIIQEIKPNKSTGKYLFTMNTVKGKKNYILKYEAPGYKTTSEPFDIDVQSSYQEIERPVDLRRVNIMPMGIGALSVYGKIADMENNVIKGGRVVVTNLTTGKVDTLINANKTTGVYNFIIKKGNNYNVSFEADGYLFHTENIQLPKEEGTTELEKNIQLDKIKQGAKIILNNIFFDNAKATLRKESMSELDKLLAFLKTNSAITIELSGHTDSNGNDNANLKLSQDRAQAVVSYLIKNGIDKSRLVAKGYGETQPIAPNMGADGKPEKKNMQLNRRVEMKIL